MGSHVTITHDALYLTVYCTRPLTPLHIMRHWDPSPDMGHGDPRTWSQSRPDMGHVDPPSPLLVTSGGHHWRPVQTCSLDLTVQGASPITTDIWWPPKHIQLANGQYASYWNVFLLLKGLPGALWLFQGFLGLVCASKFDIFFQFAQRSLIRFTFW